MWLVPAFWKPVRRLGQVLAANREARKPGAVLDGDGDTFLKNECRADKWLLLELSQVARVDAVRLAQARCPQALTHVAWTKGCLADCRVMTVKGAEPGAAHGHRGALA